MPGVRGRSGGSNRKSTVVRLIQGNAGKRPLNKHEPQPRQEMPRCPSHLDAEARREWRRVAPQLYECGLLTVLDADALAVYCACWSHWVAAERHLEEHGLVVLTNGVERASPWVKIALDAQRMMLLIAGEFGMTPLSRQRIRVVAPPAAADPFEELLKS
jgi:P27 family predicted phage terminase small subunit